MVRRGSSGRVRHWALSICRDFLFGPAPPPRRQVHEGYVRPPAGPRSPTAGAPATQSPEAARRADPERSERVDGVDGRRHRERLALSRSIDSGGHGVMNEDAPENQNEEGVADEKAPAAEERQLLTVAETAALSGLSDRAIYHAISRGELRAVRICSRL